MEKQRKNRFEEGNTGADRATKSQQEYDEKGQRKRNGPS